MLDGLDNCPGVANNDQANLDGDAYGDACDEDVDGDGVLDVNDDCPTGDVGWAANALSDHDSDGCRDITEDLDDDEDGIFDEYDVCPKDPLGGFQPMRTTSNPTDAPMRTTTTTASLTRRTLPRSANPTKPTLTTTGLGMPATPTKTATDRCPRRQRPNDIQSWISFTWNDYDGDGCLDETTDEDDDDDSVLDINDACPMGEKTGAITPPCWTTTAMDAMTISKTPTTIRTVSKTRWTAAHEA